MRASWVFFPELARMTAALGGTRITDSLQALGFTRVRSLAGGLTAWRNAGHPLTPEPA